MAKFHRPKDISRKEKDGFLGTALDRWASGHKKNNYSGNSGKKGKLNKFGHILPTNTNRKYRTNHHNGKVRTPNNPPKVI